YVRRSTKVHAHDETNACNVGDTVNIVACRPISKSKTWRLHSIVERAR
ncbi:MAG: small ribosomal subunit protein uS17, partial [Gammaproteobacteria bacterium]